MVMNSGSQLSELSVPQMSLVSRIVFSIVKIILNGKRIVKNGQNCPNLSKLSKIVKIVENGQNCQKLSTWLKIIKILKIRIRRDTGQRWTLTKT